MSVSTLGHVEGSKEAANDDDESCNPHRDATTDEIDKTNCTATKSPLSNYSEDGSDASETMRPDSILSARGATDLLKSSV